MTSEEDNCSDNSQQNKKAQKRKDLYSHRRRSRSSSTHSSNSTSSGSVDKHRSYFHKRRERKLSRSSKHRHKHRRHKRSRSRTRSPARGFTRANTSRSTHDRDRKSHAHVSLQKAKIQSAHRDAALSVLPNIYNPSSINAVRLAEQQEKRKLLWSKKDDKPTANQSHWQTNSIIASRGDSAAAAKFCKLMGIQNNEVVSVPTEPADSIRQKQLFKDLEKEYEKSRIHTHTQRGSGLGFSSHSSYAFPHSNDQSSTSGSKP